jgi:DinB superfamily
MAKQYLQNAAYYDKYIAMVPEDHIGEALRNQYPLLEAFLRAIPAEKTGYAYAEGKWPLAGVLQHITDTERVFAYRAMRFARKDSTNLPGFDENLYADQAHIHTRSLESLIEEMLAVRKATEALFYSFTEEDIQQTGMANNYPVTVSSLGFIIPGHVIHHLNIIRERYLV